MLRKEGRTDADHKVVNVNCHKWYSDIHTEVRDIDRVVFMHQSILGLSCNGAYE